MKLKRIIFLILGCAALVVAWFRFAELLKNSSDGAARDSAVPYSRFARSVGDFFRNAGAAYRGAVRMDDLEAQIEALKVENADIQALRAENVRLRRELGFATRNPGYLPAEVVSTGSTDIWGLKIRLDKGFKAGVRTNHTVVAIASDSAGKGVIALVGRIVGTTAATSDVLLLSDSNCRVSCRIGSSVGVLSGGGMEKASDAALECVWAAYPLSVEFLEKSVSLEKGAVVRTSGLTSLFREGIPIGEVISSERDATELFNRAQVRPYVNFTSLRRVFIIVESDQGGGSNG